MDSVFHDNVKNELLLPITIANAQSHLLGRQL